MGKHLQTKGTIIAGNFARFDTSGFAIDSGYNGTSFLNANVDLAATLLNGNITGGSNITVSNGDIINSPSTLYLRSNGTTDTTYTNAYIDLGNTYLGIGIGNDGEIGITSSNIYINNPVNGNQSFNADGISTNLRLNGAIIFEGTTTGNNIRTVAGDTTIENTVTDGLLAYSIDPTTTASWGARSIPDKQYVDDSLGDYLPLTGGTMTGAVSLSSTYINDGADMNMFFNVASEGVEFQNFATNESIKLDVVTGQIVWGSTTAVYGTLDFSTITDNRTWLLPNASGTLALTSDVTTTETQVAFAGSNGLIGEAEFVYDTITNTLTVPNLVVSGTNTTINTETLTTTDPIISIGGGTNGGAPTVDDNKDRGIEFQYFDGSAKKGFFGFDDSTSRFTFIPDGTNTTEVFSGTKGDVDISTLYTHDVIFDSSIETSIITDISSDLLVTANSTNYFSITNETALNFDKSWLEFIDSGAPAQTGLGFNEKALTMHSGGIRFDLDWVNLADVTGDFYITNVATTTTNFASGVTAISTQNATLNGHLYSNSVILGGTNGLVDKSNFAFVNNLEIQNGIGQYTVDPSTHPDWGTNSIPNKGYVDGLTNTLQEVLDAGAIATRASGTMQMVVGSTAPTGQNTVLSQTNTRWYIASVNGITSQAQIDIEEDNIKLLVNRSGSLQSLYFNQTTTFIEVTDTLNSKGMEYAADYGTNFTARSLVDKGYVDTLGYIKTTGNSTLTANAILFMEDKIWQLYNDDGLLTANRAFQSTNSFINHTETSSGDFTQATFSKDKIKLEGKSQLNVEVDNTNGIVITSDDTYANGVLITCLDVGKLQFNGGVTTFTDLSAGSNGIVYFSDYSATYSSRSLVDKGYVDSFKYVETFTPGTVGVANVITHGLDDVDIIVQLWDVTTGAIITADEVKNALTNSVDVYFSPNPPGDVKIVIKK